MLQKLTAKILLTCILGVIPILFSTCNTDRMPYADEGIKTANYDNLNKEIKYYLDRNPDSAIICADSAFILAQSLHVDDTSLFELKELKASAYLNKGFADSAISILERIRIIAINSSDQNSLAKSEMLLSQINLDGGNTFIAEKYVVNAIKIYEQFNQDNHQLASAYNLYGAILQRKGDHQGAQKHLMEAYRIFEKLDSLNSVSAVCINIGNNFVSIGSIADAMFYYKLASTIAAKGDFTYNHIAALRNIGILYREKNPDSALYYYNLALSLQRPEDDIQSYIISQFNIANIYLDKKDFTKAQILFNEVLNLCQLHQLYGGIARTYSGMASMYEQMGDNRKAFDYLFQARKIADSIGETSLLVSVMSQIEWIYRKEGNFKEAYFLIEKTKLINDSVIALDKQIAVHDLEKFYFTEKKEIENINLSRTKLILTGVSITLAILLTFVIRLNYSRKKAWQALIVNYRREQLLKKASQDQLVETKPNQNHSSDKSSEENIQNPDLIHQKLTGLMAGKELFLNKSLSVEMLAAQLEISRRDLSNILHKYYNQNYSQYVNQLRIDYACKLLGPDNPETLKMEYLAHLCGFNSRQVFYQVFHTIMGMSPGHFRQAILQNPSNS